MKTTTSISGISLPVRRTSVRLLSGADAYRFLASRWPALYQEDRLATPYQSREWLCGWAHQLHPTAQPLIVMCEGAAGPVAALALARHEDGRVRALGSPVAEVIRPVGRGAEDPSVAGALVQELRGLVRVGEAVQIGDVPQASALGRHLAGVPGWVSSSLPYARVALPVTYPAMDREIRKGHTKRTRRWTQLTKRFRVAYRCSRGPRELLADWESLVGLHRERFGEPPACARQLRSVLRGCGNSSAFIASLTVEGRAVASQLVLYRRHRAFSLLAAMTSDPEIARAGPGHGLLRELMTDLYSAGYASLDLGRTRIDDGGGQHSYKSAYQPSWTEGVTFTSPPARAGSVSLRAPG